MFARATATVTGDVWNIGTDVAVDACLGAVETKTKVILFTVHDLGGKLDKFPVSQSAASWLHLDIALGPNGGAPKDVPPEMAPTAFKAVVFGFAELETGKDTAYTAALVDAYVAKYATLTGTTIDRWVQLNSVLVKTSETATFAKLIGADLTPAAKGFIVYQTTKAVDASPEKSGVIAKQIGVEASKILFDVGSTSSEGETTPPPIPAKPSKFFEAELTTVEECKAFNGNSATYARATASPPTKPPPAVEVTTIIAATGFRRYQNKKKPNLIADTVDWTIGKQIKSMNLTTIRDCLAVVKSPSKTIIFTVAKTDHLSHFPSPPADQGKSWLHVDVAAGPGHENYTAPVLAEIPAAFVGALLGFAENEEAKMRYTAQQVTAMVAEYNKVNAGNAQMHIRLNSVLVNDATDSGVFGGLRNLNPTAFVLYQIKRAGQEAPVESKNLMEKIGVSNVLFDVGFVKIEEETGPTGEPGPAPGPTDEPEPEDNSTISPAGKGEHIQYSGAVVMSVIGAVILRGV